MVNDYPIKGIRTLATLYPNSRETSKLIKKKASSDCGRIDKHYNCNSNAELARKVFREFMIRVLDIIIAEQGLFILPGKSQSHIYASTLRNEIGMTHFAGVRYSFGVNSKKRQLSVMLPDVFYENLWNNARDGLVYPKLMKI
jgi:hypothetical protein